jgi:hypothetical protein
MRTRTRNVFELLLAAVLEWKLQPTGHVLVNTTRDADSSRRAERLKPSRHIDAVAEDVLIVNNNVTLVHTDPEFDPLIDRDFDIAFSHRALDGHRATNSLHSARILDENAISGRFDDAPMIRGDAGIDDLTPNGFDSAERFALVVAHQPAVADHVCHQDGCEPTLRVNLMHSRSPSPGGRADSAPYRERQHDHG